MVYKDPIAQLKKADSVELYYLGLDDEKADCESKLVLMSAMEEDEQKKLYGYEASGCDKSSAHDVQVEVSRDYPSKKPVRHHDGGGHGDGIRVMEGVNNSPLPSQPKKKEKINHRQSPTTTITIIPPPPELGSNQDKKKGKEKVVSGGAADKKEEKKYKCWDCDKEFPRYQALGGHRSSCHPKKLIESSQQNNNNNIVTGKRKFLNFDLNKPPSNDGYADI